MVGWATGPNVWAGIVSAVMWIWMCMGVGWGETGAGNVLSYPQFLSAELMQLKADVAEREAELLSKSASLRDLNLRVSELEADKVGEGGPPVPLPRPSSHPHAPHPTCHRRPPPPHPTPPHTHTLSL